MRFNITTPSNGASVLTTGTQTYNDTVVVMKDTILTSSGANAAGRIDFANTVLGDSTTAHDLTVNGSSVSFDAAVGSSTGVIGALTLNASGITQFNGLVNVGSVATDAPGTVKFNITTPNLTDSVLTTGTQTYRDAVVLLKDTTLTSSGTGAAGNIGFVETVMGESTTAHDLTINGANVNFAKSVGSSAAVIGALTVNTSEITQFNDVVTVNRITTGASGTVKFNIQAPNLGASVLTSGTCSTRPDFGLIGRKMEYVARRSSPRVGSMIACTSS